LQNDLIRIAYATAGHIPSDSLLHASQRIVGAEQSGVYTAHVEIACLDDINILGTVLDDVRISFQTSIAMG
jgi:hypothetical protein